MKTLSSRLALIMGAAAVLAGFGATRAEAQNRDLDPTYGSATLNAGFQPDPYVKSLTAGGAIRTNLGNVNAYVANAPDFKLHYTAGSYALTIQVEAGEDTTLLVNLPDGTWVANDDTNGRNPQLRFQNPQSGRYDIWVGTYGANTAPATLKITERVGSGNNPNPPPPPVATGPDRTLNPTYGSATLNAGFQPDPYVKNLTAGGSLKTSLGGVSTTVATAPDFKLHYTAGSYALTIQAESGQDTTLLINLPDGTWVANDDTNGLNPELRFQNPQSGRYDIWVGTYNGGTAPATLKITERK